MVEGDVNVLSTHRAREICADAHLLQAWRPPERVEDFGSGSEAGFGDKTSNELEDIVDESRVGVGQLFLGFAEDVGAAVCRWQRHLSLGLESLTLE